MSYEVDPPFKFKAVPQGHLSMPVPERLPSLAPDEALQPPPAVACDPLPPQRYKAPPARIQQQRQEASVQPPLAMRKEPPGKPVPKKPPPAAITGSPAKKPPPLHMAKPTAL